MKIWNYVFIITGLAILLQLAGFSIGFGELFNLIGIDVSGSEITGVEGSNSGLWSAIFSTGGILASVGVGVTIGTLTRQSPENYIILPLITSNLLLYGSILFNLAQYVLNYDSAIATIMVLLLVPLGVGFLIASVEFFRGTD